MPSRPWLSGFLAAALAFLCPTLPAQLSPAPAAPATPAQNPPADLYTLHVYATLAQVPTLIINPDGRPFPPLTPSQFFISLDGGPLFHPSQLRIEGDDPISLAIIIDDSGSQSHFLTGIADTLSRLAPKDLHPEDHVSIYAIDCKAVESVDDAPASAELIRAGVNSVLAAQSLHGDKPKPACSSAVHLWDIVAHAIQKLGRTPSRRAVLLISLGIEAGSSVSFDDLAHSAQDQSTAIFGMRDIDEFAFQRSFRTETGSGLNGASTPAHHSDSLGRLALVTGGMVFDNLHIQIEDQLHRFIAMLRSRYIIEFPRPDQGEPGDHQIQISVPSKWNYIVRYTGASMPLPDPAILKDPNTVPAAPSPATFGKHPPPPQPRP